MLSTHMRRSCLAAGFFLMAIASSRSEPEALRHEAIMAAPVDQVWAAFTTKAGLESWMAAYVDIDLRVGGRMRTHYSREGTLGDGNTIENTILSLEPLRMISIKATKPPEGFPFKTAIERMWTVVRFDDLGANRTRFTVTSMGFGDDEESKKMREFFDKGNAWTVEKLRAKFAPADAEQKTVALEKLLKSLAGSEWTLDEALPNGKTLRGRMAAGEALDGNFIVTDTLLGVGGDAFKHHGHGVFGRDPQGGGMRVWSFGERGSVDGGEVRLIGDNRMAYDWNMQTLDGERSRYYIEEAFVDKDSLRFMLFLLKAGDHPGEKPRNTEPMINVAWKRNTGASASKTEAPAMSAKRIDAEVVVPASLKDVWDAWTTTTGVSTFFAPAANIELRPGGAYEMLFRPDGPKGSQGGEGCAVLTYRPMEMLSFTWNAPPEWPEIRKERTVVVVQLYDLDKSGTRVTLTHLGFGEGKDWDEVHHYFTEAWPVVLGRLQDRFVKGAIDWTAVQRVDEAQAKNEAAKKGANDGR